MAIINTKTKQSFWIITETYSEGGFPIEHYSSIATTEEIAIAHAKQLIEAKLKTNFNKINDDDFDKYKEVKITNKYAEEEWFYISVKKKNSILVNEVNND